MLQVRLGCVERVLGLRLQPLRPCLHHRRPHRRQVARSEPAVAKGSQLYPLTGSGASLPPKDTRKQSGRTERRPSPSSSRAGAPLPRLGRVRSPPSRRPNRTPPPPISADTPPPPAASILNAVARGSREIRRFADKSRGTPNRTRDKKGKQITERTGRWDPPPQCHQQAAEFGGPRGHPAIVAGRRSTR